MTNLLIPTDFTPASFQLAQQAILALKGSKLNIILFHAFEMPDPFDLLDRNRKMPYHNLVTEPFRQSCKQLKELYPQQVQNIHFKCMEGNTAALFRNFAEANEIDFIVYPEQYVFIAASKKSVNPGPLFKKSGITLIRELTPRGSNIKTGQTKIFKPAFQVSN